MFLGKPTNIYQCPECGHKKNVAVAEGKEDEGPDAETRSAHWTDDGAPCPREFIPYKSRTLMLA